MQKTLDDLFNLVDEIKRDLKAVKTDVESVKIDVDVIRGYFNSLNTEVGEMRERQRRSQSDLYRRIEAVEKKKKAG